MATFVFIGIIVFRSCSKELFLIINFFPAVLAYSPSYLLNINNL